MSHLHRIIARRRLGKTYWKCVHVYIGPWMPEHANMRDGGHRLEKPSIRLQQ